MMQLIWENCCEAVLHISEMSGIEDKLEGIFQGIIDEKGRKTLKYQLKDWVIKSGYVHNGQTYWEYLQQIFKQIIYHNIHKANRIQNGQYEIEETKYKEYYENLDFTKILKVQNFIQQR